jgi:hypothetical protein
MEPLTWYLNEVAELLKCVLPPPPYNSTSS